MGKSTQGIHGNWWGKVGNVVGRIRQGRTVLSVYQGNVSNPRTQGQLAHRDKFKLVTQLMALVSSYIKVGFNSLDGYKYGNPFSAAVGYNMKRDIFAGTYPNNSIDIDKVTFSVGSLDNPYTPQATADGTTIGFTWSDNSGMGNAIATDKVMVLIINRAKQSIVTNFELADRSERSGEVTVPTAWTGDNIDIIMSVRRPSTAECSDSIFISTITI